MSFGRVDLEENRRNPPSDPPAPLTHRVGNFVETEHSVSGAGFIRDRGHLVVRDFNYDGRGPSVVLFAGEEEDLGSGRFVQYPYRRHVGLLGPAKLKKIVRRDIVLRLPEGMDAYKLK